MSITNYLYNKLCNATTLTSEIKSSEIIIIALSHIETNNATNETNIYFKSALTEQQEAELDSIVENHVYTEDINFDILNVEIANIEIDEQGRQINRVAAGQKGWTYLAHPFEFETAKIGSLYSKDYLGNDYAGVTLKFYNSSNQEVTDAQYENTIVRTELTFKPNYDYEIISGIMQQSSVPSTDVRIWVIGGIMELGGAYVKEFAGGLNLKMYGADEQIKTDGRAAKYMKKDTAGVPYQTNQIRAILKHDAGVQHKVMLVLEYFRA